MRRTPAEARFVRLCVCEPEAAASNALMDAAGAITDWETVVHLAVRHRVAGYVQRGAIRAGVRLPVAVSEGLRHAELTSHAVVMLLEAELERAVAGMAAAEVPVLVLKGPGLARTIYADRALRPYGDLDLTVREPDQARAVAALAGCGYTELTYDVEVQRRAHADHLHDSSAFHRMFAGADGRALIELHLDPLQLGLRTLCEAERWARAVPLPGLPGAVMLGLEDQILQLSVHVNKHGFNRLIWLKDLDLLLRRSGAALDWDLVEQQARREGIAASVWYTLQLTRALLGTPLPAAVARLRPAWAVRELYKAAWPLSSVAGLEGFLRRRALQVYVSESLRGMLPSLLFMGRRGVRARMIAHAVLHR